MGVVLDGKAIAERIKEKLRQEVTALNSRPTLAILYFGTQASLLFKFAQEREASSLGIDIDPERIVDDVVPVTQGAVERVIQQWNQDPSIHGIFVHQPMPPQIDAQRISALIDPRKDVEGIHPQNSARRFFAKARIGSCTALAVMELIDEALKLSGESLEGKEAVVVGHSEIVGRPVGMLLLDRLATTTVCHIATKNLEKHVKRADVLVVAVGRPRFIKGGWITPGAIVIDVGINVVEGRVVGDVEFEEAKERAAFISPVPGGVGPVTVMMVMKNTVEAFKLQQAI
ncbi:MAG: bifunctional 5,10-methylenetetrahydrofolate dehydrogenase/5,10-methenyltetrahydrofolate cyclohydrolase [Candidatus Omnitrophota bacterium]|nr:bifunctional 5,10-methylenetetrahydrofolate dehydrogenase/5,10-methenyltetrahydrofolate cyclohydrolase [Candidatus Omnitrophota bacterium]